MRTPAVVASIVLLAVCGLAGAAGPSDAGANLAAAPPNTWVKLVETKTGWREQPIFVYVPGLKRFVMAAGMQSTGGMVPRHYDTEEFDLGAARWFNAYPPPYATTRPETGPVGEDYSRARINQGSHGFEPFYRDGEYLRLGAGGQWSGFRTCYEWCYVPENGGVYAYLGDMTLLYDPARRTWEDLKAKPRTSNRVWGSLVYDPVNKEILHTGGDGGSADIATWACNIEKNEWRRLEFGSARQKDLQVKARELCWQAKALLGAACNRFAITETEAEAKADLKAKAGSLADETKRLAEKIKAGEPKGAEKAASDVAVRRLEAAVAALTAVSGRLADRITPEIIGEVRAARVIFEQVVDALAVEPLGRARSQAAYDPEHRKIVLFGGDHLDRVLSDTWVYDCPTRTWEQKFPARCPAPRAGHILAWLPKAKRIVLAGGYSRDWLAQEIWTYDVAANEWRPLLHVPLAPEDSGRAKFSPNCPRTNARTTQVGAVPDDDVLVCVQSARPGLITWGCMVDPARPDGSAEKATGGKSGDYTFNRIDPADWEKVAAPDAEKTAAFYRGLPANQWTALKFARYAPGARNRWGTTAYDTDRHQLLFWGGGHATSQENDVAHYSVRGNCWTLGYHPDDPIETVYASQPTPVSFNDRMHVPVHAYKAYCYDATAGLMFYFDRAYDPAAREWRPEPYAGLQHRGPMHSHVRPTSGGAVTYSDRGLFRFDAKTGRWVKLPWDGPNPGGIWCDGDGLVHDSKRNCLWLATRKDICRYDLASGKAEKLAVSKPKTLGEFLFWGEQVYLPEADLVLLMKLFRRADGRMANAAWDPEQNKFFWVDLRFVENDKEVEFKDPPFSWHDALNYDPLLKLVVLNNSSAQKVWALRFNRASAKMEEMKE